MCSGRILNTGAQDRPFLPPKDPKLIGQVKDPALGIFLKAGGMPRGSAVPPGLFFWAGEIRAAISLLFIFPQNIMILASESRSFIKLQRPVLPVITQGFLPTDVSVV